MKKGEVQWYLLRVLFCLFIFVAIVIILQRNFFLRSKIQYIFTQTVRQSTLTMVPVKSSKCRYIFKKIQAILDLEIIVSSPVTIKWQKIANRVKGIAFLALFLPCLLWCFFFRWLSLTLLRHYSHWYAPLQ